MVMVVGGPQDDSASSRSMVQKWWMSGLKYFEEGLSRMVDASHFGGWYFIAVIVGVVLFQRPDVTNRNRDIGAK